MEYLNYQMLSQYLHALREKHMVALTRVLRYLKWIAGHGLFFHSDNFGVKNV